MSGFIGEARSVERATTIYVRYIYIYIYRCRVFWDRKGLVMGWWWRFDGDLDSDVGDEADDNGAQLRLRVTRATFPRNSSDAVCNRSPEPSFFLW